MKQVKGPCTDEAWDVVLTGNTLPSYSVAEIACCKKCGLFRLHLRSGINRPFEVVYLESSGPELVKS